MKNITESMKRTAIFMELDEFENLIDKLTDGKIEVQVESGEVCFAKIGDLNDAEEYCVEFDELALDEYFDVNITSIHADGFDVTGIWIVYIDNPHEAK